MSRPDAYREADDRDNDGRDNDGREQWQDEYEQWLDSLDDWPRFPVTGAVPSNTSNG